MDNDRTTVGIVAVDRAAGGCVSLRVGDTSVVLSVAQVRAVAEAMLSLCPEPVEPVPCPVEAPWYRLAPVE